MQFMHYDSITITITVTDTNIGLSQLTIGRFLNVFKRSKRFFKRKKKKTFKVVGSGRLKNVLFDV